MDPDIAAALYGGGSDDEQPRSHVTKMPVQRIEGDPEAGMSVMEKFGRILSGKQSDGLDAERAQNPTMQSVDRAANALGGGMTAHLDQRIPFGVGDAIKSERDAARADEPMRMALLDAGGAMASPFGIEGKGAGLVANVARGAANAGLYSAARSVGDANPDEDITTQAMRALAAGGKGAGIGAAAGGAAAALGAVAPVARRFAMGGTAKQYGDIVDEMGTRSGIDYVSKDLGNIPEKQGLTNVLWPQSRAGYAKRSAARADDNLGPAIDEKLIQAESEIPAGSVDRQQPMGRLQRTADNLDNAARPGAEQVDQAITQMARAPFETPLDVAKLKRQYEGESYAKDAVAGSIESRYAKGQKFAADATRDHLRQIMDSADPVTAAHFQKLSSDYADTKLVENMSKKASMYDFAAPLVGAGVGGYAGHEIGHDFRSTAEGMAAGAFAGLRGADLVANVARGGERALGSPGIQRLGALLTDEKRASAQDMAGETRGHKIPEAIQDALRDNKLGPYSDDFARAAMSDQPGALGVAYQKLSGDPQFAPYKRLLQEMTGGMQ